MFYETERFKVTSDNYQFTLYAKEKTKPGPKVKPENVGKLRDVLIGHYPKFDMLVRGAIRYELASDDIKSLEQISNAIESVALQFEGATR
ncbi:MAG: hypothetical protein R3309_11245 [Reinekea sp.]|nr:hypothetical protein [Reinekea sp.]